MNTFTNSFIRQMGREVAHSTYKNLTDYDNSLTCVDETTFTTKFIFYNYVLFFSACFFGIFFPFIMIVPFICGLKRLFSNKIKGYCKGTYSIHKFDRRCNGGKRYCGSTESFVSVKKDKSECTLKQIRIYRIFGIIEVVLSSYLFVLFIRFWETL